MPFDVSVCGAVPAPPERVAAFLADPRNDARWIGGIVEVRPPDGPLEVGTRVERVAKFAGRRIYYTLEVVRLEPGRLLEMRSVAAPFPMRVAYEVASGSGGAPASSSPTASVVTLRVGGGPSGILALFNWLTAIEVRRNLRADLRRLAKEFTP